MPDSVDAVASGELEAARELHRAGKLDQARAAYERLLAATPDDADLLGLLGVVALQEQDFAAADEWFRRALAVADADPRIHLRNVNNLFVLLKAQGRTQAARELAGADLPDWPEDAPPNETERGRLLSLAEALALYGQPDRALSLLEPVLPLLGEDPAALHLAGRLRLERGDALGALAHLLEAAERDPGNWRILSALSVAYGRLGDAAAAREAAVRCARAAPVYVAPRRDGQEATILVLNDMPLRHPRAMHGLDAVHFTKNYISLATRLMAKEFRFASVFADVPDELPELPEADVVFNNVASGERLSVPGRLDQVLRLVERIGRPVINHPNAVAKMTRQNAAELLAGIPGLLVPRIARYWRALSRFDEVSADVAKNFMYPVIVRHIAADSSSKLRHSENKTAALVHDADELRSFLERVNWPQFYVIQYVDLRKPDGNFRKLRATFAGDEIIMSRCQYDRDWMVGGLAGMEFYDAFPNLVVEIERILGDPEATLGSHVMPVLAEIRRRIPLDLYGMDFDIDDDGRLVLFEVQATMNLVPDSHTPDRAIAPTEPGERIAEAFRRLVRRKIAEAA